MALVHDLWWANNIFGTPTGKINRNGSDGRSFQGSAARFGTKIA
jgi:hypothetical protein